ncbi:endoplasmic reticulum-based factor for assembly of V-ATPase-domain-containing protein [Scheffersomyces amazonensis]|uniref:endoplasmic reticulum-based factor for assembly of V-ATPase-domain-containing protein n=1 Tax=Scheffersomyces amazonensis TaxID=1078765 RepID=UPI00315D13A9
MSQYIITPQLKECIANIDNIDPVVIELLTKPYISKGNLINIYKAYQPTTNLLQLLSKTSLYIPNKNPVEENIIKTPEFIKSMELLRLKAKEEEYQRLVNPSPEYSTLYEQDLSNKEYISPARAHKELKSQLTTIVNIFVSVASVVYAIWYWTKSSWNLPDSYRVLLCIFFGLLILVAEVVVYMGYLNKIEEARIRERKKPEVKKIIKSVKLA